MINPYIEKSKVCIQSIPGLKLEIKELMAKAKATKDIAILKQLKLKSVTLKIYLSALENMDLVGRRLFQWVR